MLSLFRFVPGKFMLENLRNFPINTGSKIYRVNLLRHIYFLNFIKGYFTFCTVNPIRIIFKTLVYIFCISVILTSVISVWGQLSESLLRNHWINHAWRLSTHIACIFSVICAQRKWISPVGSVGASAAQRCPPDTRTPWGTQKLLDRRQPVCEISIQSDKKSDCAIWALDLISASLTLCSRRH